MENIKSKSWLNEVEENYIEVINSIIEKTKSGKLQKTETIKVSGFDIEVVKREETKKINSELLNKKNEMEKIRNDLKAKGINPIAVLPKNIFQKMISDFPFYTFREFNEKGEVKGNIKNIVQNIDDNIISYIILTSFFFSLISFVILSFYLYSIIPIVFFVVLFLVFNMLIKNGDPTRNSNDKILFFISVFVFPFFSICFLFTEIKPRINTKKKIWPNKIDEGSDFVKIILPKTPKGVENKLLKCHKKNIKTYLVIHEKGFGIETKELVKKARAKYDPIICTDSDCKNYVAIIDQFGDIPEEKKLIKKIKEQFKSITEELSLKYKNLN